MKCIGCGTDSNFRDRKEGRCPSCGKRFAFEPAKSDKITDRGFEAAIAAASSHGTVRFTDRNLYYQVLRHMKGARAGWVGSAVLVSAITAILVGFLAGMVVAQGTAVLCALGVAIGLFLLFAFGKSSPRFNSRLCTFPYADFGSMMHQWVQAHGAIEGLIVPRKEPRAQAAPAAADLSHYSFDRAVICDRSETVDLLLGNNFHFENSCAVLSITGYPESIAPVVLPMLRRNPRLTVYALHDASLLGCTLARRLVRDPHWFGGTRVRVIDVGLRPVHAEPFRGLWLRRDESSTDSLRSDATGITQEERSWLDQYVLELAVIRPEQIIKRLFRAVTKAEASSAAGAFDDGPVWSAEHADELRRARREGESSSGGDGSSSGSSDSSGSDGYETDSDSFSSDASSSDGGGGDGFG